MHWLPSYPLKTCRCGEPHANREHYQECPLQTQLLNKLLEEFGNIPELHHNIHTIDFIMNKLPRSEVCLQLGKWKQVWPTLILVLREIDRLSHPDEEFEEDEPDPETAQNIPTSQHSQA